MVRAGADGRGAPRPTSPASGSPAGRWRAACARWVASTRPSRSSAALAAELDAADETDGYVFEEIGECLLELDRTDEARPWLALAHLELARDPWLAEQEAARIERLRDLGRE